MTSTNSIYPSDNKLTMQERKDLTNKFLTGKGVPALDSLPVIDDYTGACFRDGKEVACKAMVLFGLIHVANEEKTADEMIAYFKEYGLWDYVSPEEQAYLEQENPTEHEHAQFSWRAECLEVLLWSLGHFDALPFPVATCDFSNYETLPDIDNDPTDWINQSKLRNTEEILNEADMIYRIHWATRDASLSGKPIPANLNEDVVMERHYALNWLTMYAEKWDDITTDT